MTDEKKKFQENLQKSDPAAHKPEPWPVPQRRDIEKADPAAHKPEPWPLPPKRKTQEESK